MIKRYAFAAIVFLASFGLAQAQSPALSSTAAGRRADEYLVAFNSGSDSLMRAFFANNLVKGAEQRLPLDARINRYHEMRSRAGTLKVKRVLSLHDDIARVLVETRDGMTLTFTFMCEKTQPYSLEGIEVRQASPEDEGIGALKNSDELVTTVDRFVDSLAKADLFSGVVLVGHKGVPVYSRAWGILDREKKTPNILTTRFNLGSINKNFTQVAILQLERDGKLSLGDTIGRFLPEYPNPDAARKVTVRMLLDMTSGIGDFFNERYDAAHKNTIKTIKDYLPLFADKPLLFEPGARMQYSNGGYIVLGAIIEKVSGMDYYLYVRTKIFAPAGMTLTEYIPKDELTADAARGYTKGEQGGADTPWKTNYDRLPGRGSSAGGGYSTAGDLLKYTQAIEASSIVPSGFNGKGGFGIAGGTEGANAALEYDPARGYTVVVLSNFDPPSAERIAARIRAWLPR